MGTISREEALEEKLASLPKCVSAAVIYGRARGKKLSLVELEKLESEMMVANTLARVLHGNKLWSNRVAAR